MDKEILLSTLKEFGGQPRTITVHRAFVDFTGSLEAAMMLSQLLYWSERDAGRGRIYKTDREWQEELCLTRYAVRQARQALEEIGILRTEVHRAEGSPTVHYYLLEDALVEKWKVWIRTNDKSSKTNNRNCENGKSLTESTTEITTESTTCGRAEVQPPLLHIKTEKKPAVSSPRVATASKKCEKRKKQIKPPPPAVEAFRTVRRRYPPYETWEMIDTTVGQKESDLAFWREVLTQYAAMGWNPHNIIGALDFFKRRELPSLKRKQPESRYDQLTRVLGLGRSDKREGDNGSTRTDLEDNADTVDPLSFKVAV